MNKTTKTRIIRNMKAICRELKQIPVSICIETDGTIKIGNFDYLYQFSMPTDCKILLSENIFVDAQQFIDLFQKVNIKTIEATNDNNVSFKNDDIEFLIETNNDSNFFNAFENSRYQQLTFPIDCETLKTYATYVSNDDLRPAMCGIFFGQYEQTGDEYGYQYIAATNAHVLRYARLDQITQCRPNFGNFIMPADVVKMMPNKKTAFVSETDKTKTGRRAFMIMNSESNDILYFVGIDEKYPDFLSVVPTENMDNVWHLQKSEALKFINAAKNIAGKNLQIMLSVEKNTTQIFASVHHADNPVNLKTSKPIGSNQTPITVETNAKNDRLLLNADYLKQVLTNNGIDDSLYFRFDTNARGILTDANLMQSNETDLLMPCYIGTYYG